MILLLFSVIRYKWIMMHDSCIFTIRRNSIQLQSSDVFFCSVVVRTFVELEVGYKGRVLWSRLGKIQIWMDPGLPRGVVVGGGGGVVVMVSGSNVLGKWSSSSGASIRGGRCCWGSLGGSWESLRRRELCCKTSTHPRSHRTSYSQLREKSIGQLTSSL